MFLGLPIIVAGGQKMQMIFLSSPILLIKLICVGTAPTSQYLEKILYGFWSDGDPRQEQIVSGFFVFSTKSGYPLVDHDI